MNFIEAVTEVYNLANDGKIGFVARPINNPKRGIAAAVEYSNNGTFKEVYFVNYPMTYQRGLTNTMHPYDGTPTIPSVYELNSEWEVVESK